MGAEPVAYNSIKIKYCPMCYRILLVPTLLLMSIITMAQSVTLDKKVGDVSPNNSIKPESIKLDSSLYVPVTVMHDLTIFPTINQLVKHSIFLEQRADETLYKVEIYAVKSQEVDNCNKHFLLGDFELKTLEGHGYPYYIFNSNTQIISTKMGCGDNITKIKNVPSGKTELVKYISALPLVVYAPKDIEIKYKIWKQDPKELDARSF